MKRKWLKDWVFERRTDDHHWTRASRKSNGKVTIETDAQTVEAIMSVLEHLNASNDDNDSPGNDISRFLDACRSIGLEGETFSEFCSIADREIVFVPSYESLIARIMASPSNLKK